VDVHVGTAAGSDALALGVLDDGHLPPELGADTAALARAGFTARLGTVLAVPRADGPALVALGLGAPTDLSAAGVRTAAAAFARVVPDDGRLAVRIPSTAGLDAGVAAAAVVEGVLLARHRFDLRSGPREGEAVPVTELVLVPAAGTCADEIAAGAARGLLTARAGLVSRDLATAPASLATAEAIAQVAVELGGSVGLTVEVVDRAGLVALGCGGVLGVNRGSVREPRLVRMSYVPAGEPAGHLGLVGKGITYDSGGINLKPSDASHSQMKNDMTGAGAILAAMLVLPALDAPSRVLTTRDGTTVEVVNTDAEGRLVMADALALAVEAGVDAVVDVATLTGACLRTFGTAVAGVMGNDATLVDRLRAAGTLADEPVWELPLIRRYRSQLDSPIADLKNLGGPDAGAITAGLFLECFVRGTPWAHVDIAGTAQVATTSGWVGAGPTGFGARLVVELATAFEQGRRRIS
jgi:leucyl aminopeptidase